MNVSLTPELERLVAGKVKTGMYQTASEVIREGLRRLRERDRQAQLRAGIRAGFDAIGRGEYDDYDENTTENLAADVKRRGRRRLAQINARKTTQESG
jgi:antitoxin ParD1/3/4